MADLRAHRSTLGVHGLSEPAQPGHRLAAHPDLVTAGAATGGDRTIGDGRHPDPSGGRQPVVFDQVVGDQCVGCAGLERRGLDDPVTQRQRSEFGRGEDVRAAGILAAYAGVPDCQAWARSGWTARQHATRSSSTSSSGWRR
ncbi:flavin oxidoreductase/NADH oxidase domain protein [Mycobacterium xenopi 4042]|uniref:Flavin oxidoreductase/NADH oxidase domain protein n=1 Tax=Mycobacterium xenopi 4042 TaxID=1299334 RepID=X7YHF8_MYCXE|nr:flavin oxidoreductase/NADH oxidase domain protein [Mycobacterium xenopi 4042]